MADTPTFDYPRMVRDALRTVMRDSLCHVAEHGLPGDHHFYIAFATDHDDVYMPDSLRDRYPEHITIVLQNAYSDLDCDDDGFSVTLRFGGRPARLSIPFGAVLSFYDPSVDFGLTFEPTGGGLAADMTGSGVGAEADDEGDPPEARDRASRDRAVLDMPPAADREQSSDADPEPDDDPSTTSNVVDFDRSRRRR